MTIQLQKSIINSISEINVSGSKSETNRLLLLQAIFPNLQLENISNSDDSDLVMLALKNDSGSIDIHHAGTAMRFLTAFFATKLGAEVILTGSSRMKERPIKILVEALQQLGANISYTENIGFPPIKIIGKNLIENQVSLAADVSSQYISALLLVAPKLQNGLKLTLKGQITSVPYIKMTLELLNQISVDASFEQNIITVKPKQNIKKQVITIESDWSSASYFYSIIALSKIGTQIILSSYKQDSLQGDSALVEIYQHFGVSTTFSDNNKIIISKTATHNPEPLVQNLNNCPDIAQTIAVTSFGLGVSCHLTGLHTLKIKETDRLQALKSELTKFGAAVNITENSLQLIENQLLIKSDVNIATYQDHRMAMAFAPLALVTNINIDDHEVVSKSYPNFWIDLEKIGINQSILP